MSIEEYFGSWAKAVDLREADRIMKKLKSIGFSNICPLPEHIFKAFKLCPLQSTRVCIIGQDPYNNLKKEDNGAKTPVATGIAFANSSNTPDKAYSPSLDILRDSVIDFTIPHGITNFDPSLESWEEQGVLLLNSALTCEIGKPGSHALLWRPFIRHLLQKLSEQMTGVVYVLLGQNAQSFAPYINKNSNHIILGRHPSWYVRNHLPMPSDLWMEINKILIEQNGQGIEWYKEIK